MNIWPRRSSCAAALGIAALMAAAFAGGRALRGDLSASGHGKISEEKLGDALVAFALPDGR